MSSYQLSLLEKSLIPEGSDAAEALRRSTELAQRAEALGYHRFWLNEHHGNAQLAGSAPEVLIAYLLARTERIRIGSGGVMLQHYSPYKVAEVFKVLASLGPGRVDLGIGKAPGGLPASTRALQALHDKQAAPDFEQRLAELDHFLHDSLPTDHALAGALARPTPPQLPQRILLGGSPGSARLAARRGWGFSYAAHFNGDAANTEASLRAYREAGGQQPLLALFAFAAETQAQAQAQRAAVEQLGAGARAGGSALETQHAAGPRGGDAPAPPAQSEQGAQASLTIRGAGGGGLQAQLATQQIAELGLGRRGGDTRRWRSRTRWLRGLRPGWQARQCQHQRPPRP